MVIPMPTFDSQPIFLQPSRDEAADFMRDLQSSLRKFQEYQTPLKSSVPKNPCASDLARTGCKDAQCLKRHAESLSGSCAELLLRPVPSRSVPEPSPAPSAGGAADLVSKLLGAKVDSQVPPSQMPLSLFMRGPRTEEHRRPVQQPAQGFFTVVSTDEEGHSKTFSGPLGGEASMPPELAQLTEMASSVRSEIDSVFSAFAPMLLGRPLEMMKMPEPERASPREQYPVASIGDDPEEVAAAERVKHHPCGDEIMQCRQIGGHSMGEIKQCLLKHLDQLSPRCKCFVTQVEGPEKVQRQLPPSAQAAAAPKVSVVSVGPASRVEVLDDLTISRVRPSLSSAHGAHAAHGGPCVFMMGATLVLFVLMLRKCLQCCCRAAAPAPTMAIVVPPEQTSIKLMEPLRSEDIQTVTITK